MTNFEGTNRTYTNSEAADLLTALIDERDIRSLADALFTMTDAKQWELAAALFVDEPLCVDISSLIGGEPVTMRASDLFDGFRKNLFDEKASHHMAGNYRVSLNGDTAELTAHGCAWNLLPTRDGDSLWETWGTYHFLVKRTSRGWRLASFSYFAKYNRGNASVRLATKGP